MTDDELRFEAMAAMAAIEHGARRAASALSGTKTDWKRVFEISDGVSRISGDLTWRLDKAMRRDG